MDIILVDASSRKASVRSVIFSGRNLPWPFTSLFTHPIIEKYARFFGAKISYEWLLDTDAKQTLRVAAHMYTGEPWRFESMRIVPIGGRSKRYAVTMGRFLRRHMVPREGICNGFISSGNLRKDLYRLVHFIRTSASINERLITFVIVGTDDFVNRTHLLLRRIIPRTRSRQSGFLRDIGTRAFFVPFPVAPVRRRFFPAWLSLGFHLSFPSHVYARSLPVVRTWIFRVSAWLSSIGSNELETATDSTPALPMKSVGIHFRNGNIPDVADETLGYTS
jgi:hypothetical protein